MPLDPKGTASKGSVEHLPPEAGRAAETLRLEQLALRVHDILDEGQVAHIILKGPTIALWLYESRMDRQYVDIDVLVDPDQLSNAEHVLQDSGFTEVSASSVEELDHSTAKTWMRSSDRAFVDLHFSLIGIGVDPREAWRHLRASVVKMDVGGRELPALSVEARSLHVALHAAQHGDHLASAMRDLERALVSVEIGIWEGALSLASDLAAVDSFNAGLRLLPAGCELAEVLGLPTAIPTEQALRVSRTHTALTLEHLAQTHGLWSKLRYGWRKVFPSREFLRSWSAINGIEIKGSFHARGVRLIWILRHLPRGLGVWLIARFRSH